MRKELPTVILDGVEFIVDVKKLELREKADPKNVVSFEEMSEAGNGYYFECKVKGGSDYSDFKMPAWVMLDPIGMAKKYGFTLVELAGKSDFEVMVDQKAYDLRVNKGQLPTVKIAGHIFYVDIRMDMLRPKDDFLSRGIRFPDIEYYFSEEKKAYVIPYNPRTREFQDLDYDEITEYPKDLIAVSFPLETKLDPVGWNRHHGYNPKYGLKETGIQSHFNAKIIPWEQTDLPYIIKDNLEKLEQKKCDKTEPKKDHISPRKGSGPKM